MSDATPTPKRAPVHAPMSQFPQAADGSLQIGGQSLSLLAERVGQTPFYAYDRGLLRERVAQLRAALPKQVKLHYAMKANPLPAVVGWMAGLVDGIDVASAGELQVALNAGADPVEISFAGPGKRDIELHQAVAAGVLVNVESARELPVLAAASKRYGLPARVAVRVNPDFELKGSGMKMGGGAKPFGVDAERVPAMAREVIASGAEWRGFHIFAGSQALSAAAIIEAQVQALALAADLTEQIGVALPHCNLGGGFGIPYFPGDEPLDLKAVGDALGETLEAVPAALKYTQFCVELGRYLVGEAGVYLTRIVDRKVSHGETFLVVDGGLHHQLAATGNFGTVVRRNYPVAIASRFDAEGEEEASVVGCLCTPLDRLAEKGHFPRADVGDLVAVFCAGAYGASASPAQFLGQGPAAEVLI